MLTLSSPVLHQRVQIPLQMKCLLFGIHRAAVRPLVVLAAVLQAQMPSQCLKVPFLEASSISSFADEVCCAAAHMVVLQPIEIPRLVEHMYIYC